MWLANACVGFGTQLCQNGFSVCWFGSIPDCCFFHQAISWTPCWFGLSTVPLCCFGISLLFCGVEIQFLHLDFVFKFHGMVFLIRNEPEIHHIYRKKTLPTQTRAIILVVNDRKLSPFSAALWLWFHLPTWPPCMQCISDTDAVFDHSAVEANTNFLPHPIRVRLISRPNKIIRPGRVLPSATRGFPSKAGHNAVRRQQKRVREPEGDSRLQVAARDFFFTRLIWGKKSVRCSQCESIHWRRRGRWLA